jgi:RNA polymerase sigma-70 factor, ECF subfamily
MKPAIVACLSDLAKEFLSSGQHAEHTDAAVAALEARLRTCLIQARAAWPGVELTDVAFARYLGGRAADERAVEALHAADLFLAAACLESQAEAMAAFETAFLAPLDAHVRRYDASPAFADEVRQILRERFFVWAAGEPPRIAGYSGLGALGAWVRVAAVRVALRLSQKERARPAIDEAIGADPELDYLRTRYQPAFARALADALALLDTEERNLLRLYFAEGLTIDGLAPLFQIHRATAARRLTDARERLMAGTRAQLKQALGVSGRELDSLIGLVQSRIEINLSGLFRSKT